MTVTRNAAQPSSRTSGAPPGGGSAYVGRWRRVAAWRWLVGVGLPVVVTANIVLGVVAIDITFLAFLPVALLACLIAPSAVIAATADVLRDDVLTYAAGRETTLRGVVPTRGDRTVARLERKGRPLARLATAEGRMPATLEAHLGDRVLHLEPGTGPEDGDPTTVLHMMTAQEEIVATAVGFTRGAVTDWTLRVDGRELRLRSLAGRRQPRRTLLDEHGDAWVVASEPRRPGWAATLPADLSDEGTLFCLWFVQQLHGRRPRTTGSGHGPAGVVVTGFDTGGVDGGGFSGGFDGGGFSGGFDGACGGFDGGGLSGGDCGGGGGGGW